MESEKKTKWCLKASEPTSGFQEYDFSQGGVVSSAYEKDALADEHSKKDVFCLPSVFWDLVGSDAELQERVSELVLEKAKDQVQEEAERLKREACEQGRKEGIAKGVEESGDTLNQLKDQLDSICAEVLDKKDSLLRAHETQWLEALSHLMKRFLVSRQDEFSSFLFEWLKESIEVFDRDAKVNIYLSPGNYAALHDHLEEKGNVNWHFHPDSNLQKGEIRCDTDKGGVFFSSSEQFQKLEKWITHHQAADVDQDLAR